MKAKTKAKFCWLIAWANMTCVGFTPVVMMYWFWGGLADSLSVPLTTFGIMAFFGAISVAASYYAATFDIQARGEK